MGEGWRHGNHAYERSKHTGVPRGGELIAVSGLSGWNGKRLPNIPPRHSG